MESFWPLLTYLILSLPCGRRLNTRPWRALWVPFSAMEMADKNVRLQNWISWCPSDRDRWNIRQSSDVGGKMAKCKRLIDLFGCRHRSRSKHFAIAASFDWNIENQADPDGPLLATKTRPCCQATSGGGCDLMSISLWRRRTVRTHPTPFVDLNFGGVVMLFLMFEVKATRLSLEIIFCLSRVLVLLLSPRHILLHDSSTIFIPLSTLDLQVTQTLLPPNKHNFSSIYSFANI